MIRAPIVVIFLAATSRGFPEDTLERVKSTGFFVWGADEEGGGPFVFPEPTRSDGHAGFEVELADSIAVELSTDLGRAIQARFSQGPWEKLPDLLDTGRIDVVLNGYEWTPERARRMESSVPYYIYELQLMARADDRRITGIDELMGPSVRRVGVLGGSAAEKYLDRRFPKGEVRVVAYDGNTNAMGDVVNGRLDATLQDLPIAVFYARDFPTIARVGKPVEPGRYVLFVRKGDLPMRDALNRALERLRARGELRRIYERYSIWTEIQEDPRFLALPQVDLGASGGVSEFVRRHWRTILEATWMTVFLSVASMPLAMALGLLVAIGRLYGPRLLSAVLRVYVEVLRGTPLMLQLFVIFYLLPFRIDPIPAAILGLAINYSAYEAEIYRAGLQAIPLGQMEAALALGMSRGLALRRIIVPQAVRIVIPPVTNDFIALFKDTSVCSVITVVELTKRYNISVMNHPGEVLPLALITAILYLSMSYPLSVLASRMESRLCR